MPRPSNDGKSQGQKQRDNWIFVVDDAAVSAECADGDMQPSLCKLRHPRKNEGVVYLFSPSCLKLFEVTCHKEKYRSWFVGDSVHSDGCLYITSQLDPLFLILPYLLKLGENSRYMTLEQMVYDEELPDSHKLLSCCSHEQLSLITDWKDMDDSLQVYRYSSEKTLSWLKVKTEMLADALEKKKVNVDVGGAQSAIFVRSRHSVTPRAAYLEYAHGIISDYLPCVLERDLRSCLQLPDVTADSASPPSESENGPPNKKVKLASELTPTDDYSQNWKQKHDRSKTAKLTTAQKKLSKVDKTGMKSISSFFSPKP